MINKAALLVAAMAMGVAARGSIIGPGERSGVVIFDRWDACIFYHGATLDYIAETTKEVLRGHAGEEARIDATEVNQPMNPGEAVFTKVKYVAPDAAIVVSADTPPVVALHMEAKLAVKDGQAPAIRLEITNAGDHDLETGRITLLPILLKKREPAEGTLFGSSIGASISVISNQMIGMGLGKTDMMGGEKTPAPKGFLWQTEGTANSVTYKADIKEDPELKKKTIIKPGERLSIVMEMELPPGEYDFLFGIDGPLQSAKPLVSNLAAFDVDKDGKLKSESVKRR